MLMFPSELRTEAQLENVYLLLEENLFDCHRVTVKFMKMKQKMIAKGKISESESDGDGDDEFAEFMRWKQQKRRAARRGLDDWDQAYRVSIFDYFFF